MIRVYNGHGTSEMAPQIITDRFNMHRHNAKTINEYEIKKSNFAENTSILVFGGQSVTQFKEALGDNGIYAIKSYVENGGHYLGICAGGYFGATNIDFTGQSNNGEIYKKQANGLGFFNGIAKGSITEITPTYFTGMTNSASVISISTNQDKIKYNTLYWGGPQFAPHNNDNAKEKTRILSSFHTATHQDIIMGVQCDVGTKGGKATLLGYHPEVSQKNINKWVMPSESIERYTQSLYEDSHVTTSDTYPVDAAFTFLLYQLGLKEAPTLQKN